MKKNDSTRMDAFQELVEGLLFGGLVILVPVYIGEAPEEGLIAEVLCHLKIGLAVNALRRPVVACHLLAGNFPVEIFYLA